MKKKGKISLERLRQMMVCMGVALCLVGAAMPERLSHAQRRVKPEVLLPKNFPDGFDGYGRLVRIGDGDVVIDDTHKKLTPFVTYHTPTQMNAAKEFFEVGDLVGYLTDENQWIISLWLIE